MTFGKRILFLISLFVLFLGALWVPLRTPLAERYSVLRNGWGDRTWLWAAEGENGLVCAVSRDGADRVQAAERNPDALELRFLNRQGEVLADWSAPFSRTALEGEVCGAYPADQETVFLCLWQEDDWGRASLCVYRVKKGLNAELLLSQKGVGATRQEQMSGLRVSSFTQNWDTVYFVIQQGETLTSYSCPVERGGVKEQQTHTGAEIEVLSAAPLPDGSIVTGGPGFLATANGSRGGTFPGQRLSHLTCTVSSLYCVDDMDGSVWQSDFSCTALNRLTSLSNVTEGRRLTSLTLTPSGDALCLLDEYALVVVQSNSVKDLTGALHPSRSHSLLAFTAYIVLAAFLAFLAWQVFSIIARSRIPLSVYWGSVLLALALFLGTVLWYRILLPERDRVNEKQYTELLGSVAGLALREDSRGAAPLPGGGIVNRHTYSAEFLTRRMETLLADAGAADARNFHAALARWDGQIWRQEDGSRAELNPWFCADTAEEARRQSGPVTRREGERFWYCLPYGDQVLCVSARFVETPDTEGGTLPITRGVLLWCGVLVAVLLAVLLRVNLDVRVLARGLERYAGKDLWQPLRLRSGDELEGIAVSLNALAAGRDAEEKKRDELVASYRRFVPEPVISLLGKRSILEVDRASFAVRNMTVMAVSFTFAETERQDQTRQLFESVNQVIERTASLAARKGGTVFNFNYDGYDVVFENANQAVSAAVAMGQEALALNERRFAESLPTVTLRIALDRGSVVVGIVGDGTHLEPTTISSRFAAVRTYLRLCEKLDAHILCTESVETGAEGYGSRYVGRCRVGQETARLYEVYDADLYGTRTQKASTLRKFSQAVLRLYSGDTVSAKRTFLELAHETPDDGGARYYLYLADQLTRNPELPCELT